MFRCAECNQLVSPNTKMTRIPVAIRNVTTHHIQIDGQTGREVSRTVGYGTEVARENGFCPACASKAPEPLVIERANRTHSITV